VLGWQGKALLGDHALGDVGQHRAQRAFGEVDAGDQPEVAREGDQLCPAAAAGGRRGAQHPGGRELLDDVGDGRSGQAGDPGELHLGDRTPLLDDGDHPRAIGLPQRRLRAGRDPILGHARG